MKTGLMLRPLLLAAILSPAVAIGKPTIAEQPVNVSYADLNLALKVDQETLRQRLKSAIVRACAPDDRVDPGQLADRSCFTRSMKAGRTKLDQAVARANETQRLALSASENSR